MSEIESDKTEPDARDYGSILHEVLELLGLDETMKRCTDAAVLRDWLQVRLRDRLVRQYGESPPPTSALIFSGMERRLDAFVPHHLRLLTDGWETLEVEFKFKHEMKLGDGRAVEIRGTIDRVDYHADRKCLRLIDYKTYDGMEKKQPADTHFASDKEAADDWRFARDKEGRKGPFIWQDLQLPLYALYGGTFDRTVEKTELAYLILGATEGDSGLAPFDAWEEDGLRNTAQATIREVCRRVLDEVYWPPSEKVKYDDFETIFPDGIEAMVEAPS